jgi:tetratricopeptide (TPR) repeat protein
MGVVSREILYDDRGHRRDDADVLKEVGHIGLRVARLQDAEARLPPGEPPSCPPTAFISYKWGTPFEDRWTAELAAFLRTIGWTVMLDAQRDVAEAPTVEDFVALIARCRMFVAVLTPAYKHHAIDTKQPTYVYDEIQLAMRLPHVHVLGIERPLPPDAPAPQPPRPFTAEEIRARYEAAMQTSIVVTPEANLRFDRVVRETADDDSLRALLTRLYSYRGLVLDARIEGEVRQRARTVAASEPVDADALDRLATEHPAIGQLWTTLVDARVAAGDQEGALDAARRGAATTPDWDGRVELLRWEVGLLHERREFEAAFRAAVRMLDDYPRDWLARHTVGTLLDDVGAPWFARNHLLIAVSSPDATPETTNTLGVVYLHLGALDRAADCFRETLERDPASQNARANLELVANAPREEGAEATEIGGPVLGCSSCASILPHEDAVPCAGCGMPRGSADPCTYCGTEGLAVPPLPGAGFASQCPICREGTLTMRDSVPL